MCHFPVSSNKLPHITNIDFYFIIELATPTCKCLSNKNSLQDYDTEKKANKE